MKTETLQFKVSEGERQLIEQTAKQEGTTVSRYVRACVLMTLILEGDQTAIELVAREVGSKAFRMLHQRLLDNGTGKSARRKSLSAGKDKVLTCDFNSQ